MSITEPAGTHPVQLRQEPRRMYVAGVLLRVLAIGLALASILLLAVTSADWAFLALIASVAAYIGGGILKGRAWWHISWRDQAQARTPLWVLLLEDALLYLLLIAFVVVFGSLGWVYMLIAGGFIALLVGIQLTTFLASLFSKGGTHRGRWLRGYRFGLFALGFAVFAAVAIATPDMPATATIWPWVFGYGIVMVVGVAVQLFVESGRTRV